MSEILEKEEFRIDQNGDDEWGDLPPPKNIKENKVKTETETETDSEEQLNALEKLQNGDMIVLIDTLKKQEQELKHKRDKIIKDLDEEQSAIKQRIKVAMVLSGQTPPEETALKRRGRKPGSVNNTNSLIEQNSSETTPARTASGKRFENSRTLKEVIVDVMDKYLPNHTGTVNEIAIIAMDPQRGGYNSVSSKKVQTVRVQMYELETKGQIKRNEDNTYTLAENLISVKVI